MRARAAFQEASITFGDSEVVCGSAKVRGKGSDEARGVTTTDHLGNNASLVH